MSIVGCCFDKPVRTGVVFTSRANNTKQNDIKNTDENKTSGKLFFALGGLAVIGAAALLLRGGKTPSKAAASCDNRANTALGESAAKQADMATSTVQKVQDNTPGAIWGLGRNWRRKVLKSR